MDWWKGVAERVLWWEYAEPARGVIVEIARGVSSYEDSLGEIHVLPGGHIGR